MKFSIVMATLNGAETLRPTLVSIFEQTCSSWEIIVQDGGSTDGTCEMLKKYEKLLNWRSEPDTGVYDAWNKALARVTGDWVLFLGADDLFMHKHALAQCRKHLAALPEHIQFAYGGLIHELQDQSGNKLTYTRSLRNVYHEFLHSMGLTFTSTFIRASLFETHSFDTGFTIAGDYDFCARLLTRSNLARLPVWVSYMRKGGLSSNPETFNILQQERERVLRTRVAPRAGEFVNAVADRLLDFETFIEDIPED